MIVSMYTSCVHMFILALRSIDNLSFSSGIITVLLYSGKRWWCKTLANLVE